MFCCACACEVVSRSKGLSCACKVLCVLDARSVVLRHVIASIGQTYITTLSINQSMMAYDSINDGMS